MIEVHTNTFGFAMSMYECKQWTQVDVRFVA